MLCSCVHANLTNIIIYSLHMHACMYAYALNMHACMHAYALNYLLENLSYRSLRVNNYYICDILHLIYKSYCNASFIPS